MATTTRALGTRLQKLELAVGTAGAPPKVMRLVVCDLGRALNLERSNCTRMLGNGCLTELVDLHGDRSQLSDEEFERFVASFPIEGPSEAGPANGARIGTRQGSMAEAERPAAAEAGRARREGVDATC
jgi:hypothetical protein